MDEEKASLGVVVVKNYSAVPQKSLSSVSLNAGLGNSDSTRDCVGYVQFIHIEIYSRLCRFSYVALVGWLGWAEEQRKRRQSESLGLRDLV